MNCLPFPNRNSDSGVLYIVFKRFHPILPMAHLVFQVEARFMHSLSNHAYASHPASHISYHVHVLVVYYVVCFVPVLLLRVGSVNVEFVRTRSTMSVCLLHGLVLLPCGISGTMTIPRNHFYLCLLVARSIAMPMLRYPPLAISCLPYC